MPWEFALSAVAIIAAEASADAPRPAPLTYRYAVTSPHLGKIGTYVRALDSVGGVDRTQSHLRIAVRLLGVTVYREDADQTEVWRGGRLIAFQSMSKVNAAPLYVHGEVRDGRLMITTPAGARPAPPDLSASDPWSSRRLGPATIVWIKTGEFLEIRTTGGETDKIILFGVPIMARHYCVSTSAQPNRWEVWLDAQGVPVKLRSLEHGRAIDLSLVSQPMQMAAVAPAQAVTGIAAFQNANFHAHP